MHHSRGKSYKLTQNFLQLLRLFQLDVSSFVPLSVILLKDFKEFGVLNLHFHLLFRRSISMTNYCNHTPVEKKYATDFYVKVLQENYLSPQFHHFSHCSWHNGRIIQLKRHTPRNFKFMT